MQDLAVVGPEVDDVQAAEGAKVPQRLRRRPMSSRHSVGTMPRSPRSVSPSFPEPPPHLTRRFTV